MGPCLLSFVRTASAKEVAEGGEGRGGNGFGFGIGWVEEFCFIGSFVAKNLEILLTYKYVRVCLVSSVYGNT